MPGAVPPTESLQQIRQSRLLEKVVSRRVASWMGIGLGKAMPGSWGLNLAKFAAWPFGHGGHAEVGPMLEKSQRVHSQPVMCDHVTKRNEI